MRQFFVALMLAAAGVLPAYSAQYDDPAVAICEQELFLLAPPQGTYERINKDIDGLKVTITYTDTIINIRPDPKSFTCKFIKENDRFILVLAFSPKFDVCETLEKTNVDRCSAALRHENSLMKRRAEKIIKLREAGIYPIAPEKTDLQSE